METGKPEPCALFKKENKCSANTGGEKLCYQCRHLHPVTIRFWRRRYDHLGYLFKEIDEKNEDPKTCVTRRKRYVDSDMAKDVVECWKGAYRHLQYPKNPGVIFCSTPTRVTKDDTICDDCVHIMNITWKAEIWTKYFMEDGTVKEEFRKPAEDTATLSSESS